MQYIVDGCTPEDLDDIVATMAPEAKAAYDAAGINPRDALGEAMAMAHLRSIVKIEDDEQEVLAVFGWWDNGYLFLVWREDFLQHARKHLRQIKDWVEALTIYVGGLWMYIADDRPQDQKWARWLGFQPVEQFDYHGIPFTTYARGT